MAAIEHGVERIRGGFPLSLRLIREMHGIILKSGRGATKQPGEFRRSQNWIGGTRPGNALFVPPPPNALDDCLDTFERFLHAEDAGMPPLIRAGQGAQSATRIVNVLDPSIVGDYLATPAGERLIVNVIRRNRGGLDA